jgi:carboxylate-amine ligase
VKLRSVGVEEELLLVDPGTGRPSAVAGSVLRAAESDDAAPEVLEHELQQQQLETNTEPRRTLDELGAAFQRQRYRRSGDLAEVVSRAVAITAP